ncbi:hypothetical protein TB2_044162 [Malus domestica]|uniref:uncharacterized protein At5g65660-like n=1 Tax=Malus sylvestris TaxID=3752 RepID=UPI0010AA4A7A|nr:uncharacterized protein At5g65660-like [Malus domestica]XP_050159421.1 uncharacterized protein At5g65660-like [Malus sylvestris]
MEQNDEVSTPSLDFPVGLALLLLLLLSVSTFFLCCLHWDKVRSLFLSSVEEGNPDDHILPDFDQKPTRPNMMEKQNQQKSLTVLMPGEQVPKFIAIACPCQPPVMEKLSVVVQKPTLFQ